MTSMSPVGAVNGGSAAASNQGSVSPRQTVQPKNVAFELLFTESPQYRARLPMRVQIYPHDTTDSIVTTVKNFYGLYSGPTGSKGVSFEDENGITLIARYENFRNNMVVYVRVIEEPPSASSPFVAPAYQHPPVAAQPFFGVDGYPLQPPPRFGHEISRPSSRSSRKRSPSPNASRGRRSGSANANAKKGRSRSSKNRDTGASGHAAADIYSDSVNGYSSGDGAPGSSSGRAKEQIGNTEISVDNIVEGGRRKRAKFESSVSLPTATYDSVSSRLSSMLILSHIRSFPYLRLRRCRRLLRTPPCLLPDALSLSDLLCLLSNPVKTPSRTPCLCNPRRATIMDTDTVDIMRRHLQNVMPVAASDTLARAATTVAWAQFFPPRTQLLAAACRKRTRM